MPASAVGGMEAGLEVDVAADDEAAAAGSKGAADFGFGAEVDAEAEAAAEQAAEEAAAGAAGRRQSAKQKLLCSMTISSSCDPV